MAFILTLIMTALAGTAVYFLTRKAVVKTNERGSQYYDGYTYNRKLVTIVASAALVVMILASSVSTVGVGEVGIKTRFGATIGRPLSPGIAVHFPYIETISIMDTKIKKIEVDANSASKDLQTVSSKIALNYSVSLKEADSLFKEVGVNYEDIIVKPAIQESVKAATALYTAEELITKRQEVSQKMQENINNKIKA